MSLPPLQLDSGPDSQHSVLGLEEPSISLSTAGDVFWFCARLEFMVGQTKFCIFSPKTSNTINKRQPTPTLSLSLILYRRDR